MKWPQPPRKAALASYCGSSTVSSAVARARLRHRPRPPRPLRAPRPPRPPRPARPRRRVPRPTTPTAAASASRGWSSCGAAVDGMLRRRRMPPRPTLSLPSLPPRLPRFIGGASAASSKPKPRPSMRSRMPSPAGTCAASSEQEPSQAAREASVSKSQAKPHNMRQTGGGGTAQPQRGRGALGKPGKGRVHLHVWRSLWPHAMSMCGGASGPGPCPCPCVEGHLADSSDARRGTCSAPRSLGRSSCAWRPFHASSFSRLEGGWGAKQRTGAVRAPFARAGCQRMYVHA